MSRSRGPGWVPNQHGAWAMLASPLAVGGLAGGPAWVHLPLTGLWFVGYFAFFATSLWLKARRRPRYWPPVRAYGAATLLLGLATLALEPGLVVWAPVFLLPLGVGLAAAAARRERELLSGLATVVGSGLMTVVAYAAGPGPDLGRAWLLALTQFLYFAGTVFYVKSAIRERGHRRFLWESVAAHLVATGVVLAYSPWLALAFVVLTARAAVVPPLGATPKQLGIGEIVATLVVAVVSLVTV
ncbi:YwiC-like family protein [Intrasporangium calvum]|uniref:YwiC-like family protein n=1 Tax=Intrasporangium calvum TaxID=53358 RepID=UPI001F36AFFA|nr:YwiC-like family protein [Intrasporangium calvum]